MDPDAPSAARVVYDHYGGAERFPDISPDLMRAVDQADSAQYSLEEVLNPTGWVLLNFLIDSRTGLGRFRDFRISNYQLMMQLIDACQRHTIDEILELPDVKERVDLYHQQSEAFVAQRSGADIGALMLSYGGGGHANAGTCQVAHDEADRVVEELVGHLNAANPAPV